MNVLSTATRMPRRCARSLTAAMSVSCMSGFVGVSTNTMRVFGVNAASIGPVSVASTNVNSSPCRRHTLSKSRNVPP
jgi:hypothetical protein